jgi:hypothetical protein
MEGGNMEIACGKIIDLNEHGLTIHVPYQNTGKLIKCKYETCLVGLNDGRRISDKQRNTIYAFMTAVDEYQGEYDLDVTKAMLKTFFLQTRDTELEQEDFSLANCSMTVAHNFIKFLITFLSKWDIPVFIGNQQISILDFINNDKDLVACHVWACLKYKKCVVCGGAAEVHHTPAIGMGGDRTEIVHEGMTVQPLCRGHHTECHTIGQKEFDNRFHLTSIVLDKELCKVWDLKTKEVI